MLKDQRSFQRASISTHLSVSQNDTLTVILFLEFTGIKKKCISKFEIIKCSTLFVGRKNNIILILFWKSAKKNKLNENTGFLPPAF
jgi:hypothetical protein